MSERSWSWRRLGSAGGAEWTRAVRRRKLEVGRLDERDSDDGVPVVRGQMNPADVGAFLTEDDPWEDAG